MPKYMCLHTMPGNSLTRAQAEEIGAAAQRDPVVRGYRSFLNLTEGKVMCVFEAPNREALETWFKRMNVPVDSITPVELEGDHGRIIDTAPAAYAGQR